VDHTNQVTACAIGIAKFAQAMMEMEINMDWLIAGAILHDVDKAVMCDGKTKRLASIGKLLPHSAYSVYLALKHRLPVEIVHMISTHTAFSVKRQITAEALILHMADYSVADLRNIKEGVDYLWSQQQPCYAELGILGPPKLASDGSE
jgi:7,8-dihydroneopterin 2',3'-cyclic phosphate phosphodiesterase